MLARLQRLLVFTALAAVIAWLAWFGAQDKWLIAVGGAAAVALGHALVLGAEFVLLTLNRSRDPAPRATLVQLSRAWAGEAVTAPIVFGWRQPFRAHAIGDNLATTAGQRGVVFVHGFVCNRAFWNPWFTELRRRGIAYASVNLEPVFGSIDGYPPLIESAVRRIEDATQLAPLVVCHSMGGLAVRAWLRDNAAAGGADERVHHVVTIGSPHHGTWLARWAFSANGRQMRQGGPWLERLAIGETPRRRRRFTCIYGHCDNIVFPPSTAVLPDARAVHVEGTAHVDLAFHPAVFQETMRCLAADMALADAPSTASPIRLDS